MALIPASSGSGDFVADGKGDLLAREAEHHRSAVGFSFILI